MTREEITQARASKKAQIQKLKEELIDLYKADCLLCDGKQHFIEKEEEYFISKRPKKIGKRTVGRIHWKELFYDGDYPNDKTKAVEIERSQVVRINGEWI